MTTRPIILPWNAALVAIGLIDLATTLVWLHVGCAVEFNPIMASILSVSLSLFVITKLATLGAYLLVVEWYRRRRNTAFAVAIGRIAVLAYIAIYTISLCSVNHAFLFG